MTSAPDIEVAKITSRQAIIVALIGAVCTLIGAVVAHKYSAAQSPAQPLQHYIKMPTKIDGVPAGQSVRVAANVNGQNYSYPSTYVWANVGPDMPTEKFPLPFGGASFNVWFKVFVKSKNGHIQEVDTNPNAFSCPEPNHPTSAMCIAYISVDGVAFNPSKVVIHYEIQ
jgi:hypothetical protein